MPFDSYNTTAVTINRGPNAMIQGVDFDTAYAQSARFGNTGNFSSYQDVFNALRSYLPDPLKGLSNPRFEPALPDSGAFLVIALRQACLCAI